MGVFLFQPIISWNTPPKTVPWHPSRASAARIHPSRRRRLALLGVNPAQHRRGGAEAAQLQGLPLGRFGRAPKGSGGASRLSFFFFFLSGGCFCLLFFLVLRGPPENWVVGLVSNLTRIKNGGCPLGFQLRHHKLVWSSCFVASLKAAIGDLHFGCPAEKQGFKGDPQKRATPNTHKHRSMS